MEALRRLKTVLAPILLRRTKVKPEKRRPVAKNIGALSTAVLLRQFANP